MGPPPCFFAFPSTSLVFLLFGSIRIAKRGPSQFTVADFPVAC